MKKTYVIKNIHCADCARSLEEVISGLPGVKLAKINFVTEKMDLEISEELYSATFLKVQKIIKDFSSKVVFYEDSIEPSVAGETIKFNISGLSCPNCAQKITDSLKKLREVTDASINFELGVLTIQTSLPPTDAVKSKIKSLLHSIEPKLKIKEANSNTSKINLDYLCYALGLILALPIFLCEFGVIQNLGLGYWFILFGSVLLLGFNTYLTAIKMLFHANINENLLVTISVFGAIIIGESTEAIMVIALYTLGKILEAKAVNRSREAIQGLMDLSPEYAVVMRDGKEERVQPKEIKLGETIVVRPGEKVALDGKILAGAASISTQSLTGESRPVSVGPGSEVMSGVVVLDGVLQLLVTKEEHESTTTKITKLIEQASENKSKTETFISRFSKYYTLIVVALAIVVGTIVGLVTKDASEGVYRGLVFLVISCPCAFAISVPLGYFGGIGAASKKGILVKGSNYLDAANKAKLVVFDKTGTLTTGEFKVTRVELIEDAYTESEIAFLAAVGEQYSIHPLAKTIVKYVDNPNLPKPESFTEIAGLGINFVYGDTEYFVGRDEENSLDTVTIVKKGNVTLGKIHFEDTVKKSSAASITELKKMGIRTALLSGDKTEVAKTLAERLGVDEFEGDMLPQDKYEWLVQKRKTAPLIYVGDGINDAPSLAVSDVGVSMGIHGSQVSVEASDVVLVDDDPAKLPELIKTSSRTKKIVLQNIVFASVIKILCLALGTIGVAKMFMAVMADVGVTILAVLNSLRALNAKSSKKAGNA